jgi:hypothetical protein
VPHEFLIVFAVAWYRSLYECTPASSIPGFLHLKVVESKACQIEVNGSLANWSSHPVNCQDVLFAPNSMLILCSTIPEGTCSSLRNASKLKRCYAVSGEASVWLYFCSFDGLDATSQCMLHGA